MGLNGSLGNNQANSITAEFDGLTTASAAAISEAIWIGGFHRVMWETELDSGGSEAYIIDLEGSMDGANWNSTPLEQLGAGAASGAGITSKFPWVRFVVSTIDAGPALITIRLNASLPGS